MQNVGRPFNDVKSTNEWRVVWNCGEFGHTPHGAESVVVYHVRHMQKQLIRTHVAHHLTLLHLALNTHNISLGPNNSSSKLFRAT